jgi:hypothetical protein
MQMGMVGNLWVLPLQDELPNGTDLNGFTHQTGYTYAYNDGDGSTYYDKEYPMQLGGFDREFHDLHLGVQPLPFADMHDTYPLLNGRGYPDTIDQAELVNLNGDPSQKISSLIEGQVGERILLRFSNLSTTELLTIRVLGITMQVIGKDAKLLRGPTGLDTSYLTSAIMIGGGESYDVILDLDGVAPGTYFLYATNLNQLSNHAEDLGGLMTEIVVSP